MMERSFPADAAAAFGRREFILSAAAMALAGCRTSSLDKLDEAAQFDLVQSEAEAVSAADFRRYLGSDWLLTSRRFVALRRLEESFDKLLREVRETQVGTGAAVWHVYNMGIVVKTPCACFAVDLMHRRAAELAPQLDFALITHNHDDHYTLAFYDAMNNAGKPVISNFLDNYGCTDQMVRGYAPGCRTLNLADVAIRTQRVDHNDYLVDFTTAFEIDAAGYRILHSGDCSSLAKLNPSVPPDLWCVHPYCGIEVVDGYAKIRPQLIAVQHINELGHELGNWRWSWQDGLNARDAVVKAGGRAVLPHWGERIR